MRSAWFTVALATLWLTGNGSAADLQAWPPEAGSFVLQHCVRVKCHDWIFVTMPPEEWMKSLDER